MPATDWTADLIEKRTTQLLGKQGPFRPTVRLVSADGVQFVAKDYRACTALYRWTVGAWNLRRERAALERLAGLDGVPLVEASVGPWILVMTHFEGRDLGKAKKRNQTPEFFDELMALVEQMHARGVVHLDLRQRRNVLIRPGRRPAILDFGSALCVKPGSRLARFLGRIDRSGVLKYKLRANPDGLSRQETRALRRVERRRRFWPFS